MEPRIVLIGIAMVIAFSSITGVMAASNTTGNNTDIGSAKQLEKLTANNSLANASSMTSFNDTTNQTSNQTSNQTGNQTSNQTSNQTANMSG